MKSTYAGYHLCRLGSFSCLVSLAFSAVPLAHATELTTQEIVVNDCEGNTRAQIQGGKMLAPHQLKVSLSDKDPMPEFIKLTSAGKQVEEKVVAGEVSFADLRSGTYQLCDDQKLTRISHISLEPAGNTSATTIGGIVAGAAALGGTALALNSGGGSDSSPSTGNSLSEAASAPAPSTPEARPADIRKPSSRKDRDCLNGAKVNPISPFD